MNTKTKKPPTRAQQKQLVDLWNRGYPIGTPVVLRRDSGETIETNTRSEAWLTDFGMAVIMLEGVASYYSLSRVQRRP